MAVCAFVAEPGPLIGGSRAEEARHPVPLAPGALAWPRAQSLGHPPHQCVRELQAAPLPTGAGEGRGESGQSRVVVPSGSPKLCALGRECHRGHRLSCPPQRGQRPRLRRGRGPHPGAPPPAHVLPWQIKSDKQQLGSVIYSIQGPGVDEEPRGVFSIDKFTGKVFLNALLDREKTDRFRVRALAARWRP